MFWHFFRKTISEDDPTVQGESPRGDQQDPWDLVDFSTRQGVSHCDHEDLVLGLKQEGCTG